MDTLDNTGQPIEEASAEDLLARLQVFETRLDAFGEHRSTAAKEVNRDIKDAALEWLRNLQEESSFQAIKSALALNKKNHMPFLPEELNVCVLLSRKIPKLELETFLTRNSDIEFDRNAAKELKILKSSQVCTQVVINENGLALRYDSSFSGLTNIPDKCWKTSLTYNAKFVEVLIDKSSPKGGGYASVVEDMQRQLGRYFKQLDKAIQAAEQGLEKERQKIYNKRG